MHALSGCDTVSYPCGKGKLTALKVIQNNDMSDLDVLVEYNTTQSDMMEAGKKFFLSLYSQTKSLSLNQARHTIYSRKKKPPKLKNLPPTDLNLALHVRSAHLQMLLWKAADKPSAPVLDITNYGWDTDNNTVMPCISRDPVAPPGLLDVISCGCQAAGKACSQRNCSCVSAGLSCTAYCVCEGGDICCNPHSKDNDLDDEDDENETEQFSDIEDGSENVSDLDDMD